MSNEKKRKTQYNWKFKGNESDNFHEWFAKQDNIALSLKSLVEHHIGLYGTDSVLDPSVQKEMTKDSIILESLRGKNALVVNQELLSNNVIKTTSVEELTENGKKANGQKEAIDKSEKDESKPIVEKSVKQEQQEQPKVTSKVNFAEVNSSNI